ncbi:MAG: phosphoglucosamine mutase [Verrucomicrobia bacterium]|nr:phosphoglucosamine mutase [Verrucomicrobiota bacterium]MDA1086816.1 phosphoglucosamine mutase [Verrucomicrobiota bacterium]
MRKKLFGTDGIRGVANQYPMTAEVALRLGKSLAYTFRNTQEIKTVLIGKDTRLSGYLLETALTSGICSMGLDVSLVGPLPTPAVAHLTTSLNANAGIMISASHNPAQDNGIKVFTHKGIKLSDEKEREIEDVFFSNEIDSALAPPHQIGKARRLDSARGRYIEFAKSTTGYKDLSGLKVVIDCANGAAYSVAPQIFQELGVELIVIGNTPDGTNINLDCGALHLDNLAAVVIEVGADAGLAFDGDSDRLMAVTDQGAFVNGDHIMALMALDMKSKGQLCNDTLVTTVMSNIGLKILMRENQINVIETAVGDRYVHAIMSANGYNLGGEQSGHLIFQDKTPTGDGIISGLQLLSLLKDSGKPLSEMISVLREAPQTLINIDVTEKPEIDRIRGVPEAIQSAEQALGDEGRVLVRYSGTELIARVLIEGPDEELVSTRAHAIADAIRAEIGA